MYKENYKNTRQCEVLILNTADKRARPSAVYRRVSVGVIRCNKFPLKRDEGFAEPQKCWEITFLMCLPTLLFPFRMMLVPTFAC